MSRSISRHCASVTSLGYLFVLIPTTYGNHPLWDRLLAERPEALPALQKALASDSVEVRRKAEAIIDEIQTRLTEQKARRILTLVKHGEADQFIDQMAAAPDRADAATWQAVMDLTQNIIAQANKANGKNTPFPVVATAGPGSKSYLSSVRLASVDELKGGTLSDRRVIAHQDKERQISNGQITRCLLISPGSVRSNGSLLWSVVFANGDIAISCPARTGHIYNSVVYCDGSIEVDNVEKSILIATGPIKIKGKIDAESIIIEKTDTPLGLLKLYDTRQAGIEVEEKEDGVRVKAVLEGKPFAKAGFKVGDQVLAINGEKLTKREDFRKGVRRAAMANKEAVFKVQRPQNVVEIKVPLTDDPR
jgi:hypothetical protein